MACTLSCAPPPHHTRTPIESLQLYVPVAHALGLGSRLRDMEELSYRALFPDSYDRFFAWHRDFAGLGQRALLRVRGRKKGREGHDGAVDRLMPSRASTFLFIPSIISLAGSPAYRGGDRGLAGAAEPAGAVRDPGAGQVRGVGVQEGTCECDGWTDRWMDGGMCYVGGWMEMCFLYACHTHVRMRS